jgi:hypothetical protein
VLPMRWDVEATMRRRDFVKAAATAGLFPFGLLRSSLGRRLQNGFVSHLNMSSLYLRMEVQAFSLGQPVSTRITGPVELYYRPDAYRLIYTVQGDQWNAEYNELAVGNDFAKSVVRRGELVTTSVGDTSADTSFERKRVNRVLHAFVPAPITPDPISEVPSANGARILRQRYREYTVGADGAVQRFKKLADDGSVWSQRDYTGHTLVDGVAFPSAITYSWHGGADSAERSLRFDVVSARIDRPFDDQYVDWTTPWLGISSR